MDRATKHNIGLIGEKIAKNYLIKQLGFDKVFSFLDEDDKYKCPKLWKIWEELSIYRIPNSPFGFGPDFYGVKDEKEYVIEVKTSTLKYKRIPRPLQREFLRRAKKAGFNILIMSIQLDENINYKGIELKYL